jgi:hypothetical protein
MTKRATLFVEHLENVSWSVLKDYPTAARELIRGRNGIYALYRRDKLYYVGLATSLMGRVKQHLRDQHKGAWDRFSVYLTATDAHMRELESLVVRIVAPPGNQQTGRLKGARDLRKKLNARIRDHDDDRRSMLLGGDVARARRRRKTRRGTGTLLLAGLVERPTALRATHKGKTFRARLRRDGWIRFAGKLFDNPSAAARAAAGRYMPGWWFWRVRIPGGGWEKLRVLKR